MSTELETWHRDFIRRKLEELKAKLPQLDCQAAWQKHLFVNLYEQVLHGSRACRFSATLKKKPGSSTQETILVDSFRRLVETLAEAELSLDDIAEIATDIPSHGQLSGTYKLPIPPELYRDFVTA